MPRQDIEHATIVNKVSMPAALLLLIWFLASGGVAENLYWDAYEGWPASDRADIWWAVALLLMLPILVAMVRQPVLVLRTTAGERIVPLSRLERRRRPRLLLELQSRPVAPKTLPSFRSAR